MVFLSVQREERGFVTELWSHRHRVAIFLRKFLIGGRVASNQNGQL